MNASYRRLAVASAAVVFFFAGCSQHRSEKPGPQVPPPVAKREAPPMPSKEEMMAKWQEYATPGPEHKVLDSLIGNWDHTVQWWMEPSAPPETSKGRSNIRWVMGKRFLEHAVTGKMMGKPFEGKGLVGFDKATREYRSIWFDNQGTGFMVGEGKFDPATKTLTDSGLAPCSMMGEVPYRAVTTLVDPNHFQYEMYMQPPGHEEMKVLRIDYTKRKAG